jgi:hypothetical protein
MQENKGVSPFDCDWKALARQPPERFAEDLRGHYPLQRKRKNKPIRTADFVGALREAPATMPQFQPKFPNVPADAAPW